MADKLKVMSWEEHVAKLTANDLSSAEACRTHLNLFATNLVAQGFVDTAIADESDVTGVIAEFLRGSVEAPAASALKIVTKEAQRIKIMRTCEYLGAEAKKEAIRGQGRATVELYVNDPSRDKIQCKDYCDLCVCCYSGSASAEDVLQSIYGIMHRQLGYTIKFSWKTCQQFSCSGRYCTPNPEHGPLEPPCCCQKRACRPNGYGVLPIGAKLSWAACV